MKTYTKVNNFLLDQVNPKNVEYQTSSICVSLCQRPVLYTSKIVSVETKQNNYGKFSQSWNVVTCLSINYIHQNLSMFLTHSSPVICVQLNLPILTCKGNEKKLR